MRPLALSLLFLATPALADTYVLAPISPATGLPTYVGTAFTPQSGHTITTDFPAGMPWVDITGVLPVPQPGWTYSGGVWTAPVAVAPPAAQTQAQTAPTLSLSGTNLVETFPDGSTQIVPLASIGTAAVMAANPLTSIAMNMTTGVITGTTVAGSQVAANTNGGTFATSPAPVSSIAAALNGTVTTMKADGTTATTGVVNPLSLPTYAPSVPISTGNTYQLPAGYAVYTFTSGITVLAVTFKLPASPVDRQTARIATTGAITTAAVQDASGNAVASGLGIGLNADLLFQYQGSAWVRIGS